MVCHVPVWMCLYLLHTLLQVKRGRPLKKNPLKNLGALLRLNPYAKTARRQELLHQVCFPACCLWLPTFGVSCWKLMHCAAARPAVETTSLLSPLTAQVMPLLKSVKFKLLLD